jgi:predicted DNA-binding WGR domain protein
MQKTQHGQITNNKFTNTREASDSNALKKVEKKKKKREERKKGNVTQNFLFLNKE